MSGQHASFSPSSAHRVITCPASFLACKDLPDTPNWAAVEGTIAHFIHEYCLLNDKSPDVFVGMRPIQFMDPTEMRPEEWAVVPDSRGLRDANGNDPSYYWTQADADLLKLSIERCLDIVGDRYVEQRLDISKYTPIPGQFGTSDHIVIGKFSRTLYVDDLKWGVGVKVYAEMNYQAILYALGVIEEYDFLYDFDKVVIRIMQPRLDHFDEWHTTADELREIGKYILERFTLAMQPNAPFNPDEKACKFCKAKATCPALAQRAQEVALGMFDDLDSEIPAPKLKDWPLSAPDHDAMTPEQMSAVLLNRSLIEGFFEALEKRATYMLLHSQPVPNFKLVEGRSVRVVKNSEGYEAYLREHGVEPYRAPELVTITEAEKALKTKDKKAGLAAYLDKPRGKPTLALASDKREAYTATSDDMFDAVPESDDEL